MEDKVTVIEDKSEIPEVPIECIYVASMNTFTDLAPDYKNNAIAKYQERIKSLNDALSVYPFEDSSTKQGTVDLILHADHFLHQTYSHHRHSC